MLLKNIDPFVRLAIITKLTKHSEHDVFKKLRTPDCRLFYIVDGKGRKPFQDRPLSFHEAVRLCFRHHTGASCTAFLYATASTLPWSF